jgi:hypothetical protein
MPGGDKDYVDARITHHLYMALAMCRVLCAARSGSATTMLLRGETFRATGWLARAAAAGA